MVHCTITRQQTRPGYVTEFTEFWARIADVKRIWFSLYTPQKGEVSAERLEPADRARVVGEISALRARHPKLHDMRPSILASFLRPPKNPDECLFSKTTACLSSDLKRAITPCQFGGDPDCEHCGCLASAGLDALGRIRLGGVVPIRALFDTSQRIGASVKRLRAGAMPSEADSSALTP